jgi:AcrR family transcriptional regulator
VPRPRIHDEADRAALLDAAEAIIERDGPHALSVRGVAAEVGTTTRAVYSLFGSKGGLVAELAVRAFNFLRDELDRLPVDDDPELDLQRCGVVVYRRFVRERPSLYRIAFQRAVAELELTDELLEAREESFGRLEARVQRLQTAGKLRRRTVRAAAVEFNAMCEGLANAELRGGTLRATTQEEDQRAWEEAFETVVAGLTREGR